MPTYRFWCPVCNAEIERMQPYAFPPPDCPTCADNGDLIQTHRIPSAPNFAVQGFNAKNGYSR